MEPEWGHHAGPIDSLQGEPWSPGFKTLWQFLVALFFPNHLVTEAVETSQTNDGEQKLGFFVIDLLTRKRFGR